MRIGFQDFTRNNRVKSISKSSHCKENSSIKENGMNQPGGTHLLIINSQKFLAVRFLFLCFSHNFSTSLFKGFSMLGVSAHASGAVWELEELAQWFCGCDGDQLKLGR